MGLAAGCDLYGDVFGGPPPGSVLGRGGSGGSSGQGGGAGGAGAGDAGGGIDPGASGLPCDVAAMLNAHCVRCHGAPLAGGAPMRLATRDDLLAASASYPGQTEGQRSLARMQAAAPMPPAPATPPSAVEISAFQSWVNAGMPQGSCQTQGGGDGGSAPLTCTSGVMTWRPVNGDPKGGTTMAPGLACRACHAGQNFQDQNPGGAMSRTDQVLDVMGTVYPALHERDLCAGGAGTSSVFVEILAADGGLRAVFTVNAVGNFMGDVPSGLPNPYRARVVRGTAQLLMATPQVDGDCNTCHTEQGLNGAPGRIVAPP